MIIGPNELEQKINSVIVQNDDISMLKLEILKLNQQIGKFEQEMSVIKATYPDTYWENQKWKINHAERNLKNERLKDVQKEMQAHVEMKLKVSTVGISYLYLFMFLLVVYPNEWSLLNTGIFLLLFLFSRRSITYFCPGDRVFPIERFAYR